MGIFHDFRVTVKYSVGSSLGNMETCVNLENTETLKTTRCAATDISGHLKRLGCTCWYSCRGRRLLGKTRFVHHCRTGHFPSSGSGEKLMFNSDIMCTQGGHAAVKFHMIDSLLKFIFSNPNGLFKCYSIHPQR